MGGEGEFRIWNFGLRISCWRHSYETGCLIALDSRLNLARHEIRNPKFQIRNSPGALSLNWL